MKVIYNNYKQLIQKELSKYLQYWLTLALSKFSRFEGVIGELKMKNTAVTLYDVFDCSF